uniref:FA core complex associated protein 100 n=1 Tax=Amphiprion percula TaxID=161767 RepID=A0A3P8RNV8_AMPPE
VMEGRCAVETWTEFGFLATSTIPKVRFGTDVFICTGSDEVCVFSTHERRLKASNWFSASACVLCKFIRCLSLNLTFHPCRAQSSSPDASSNPAELKISSEFLVIEANEVLSLLLVGSVLLTVCQRDSSWLVTLYKTPEQTPSSSYEVLGSFSLPLVSAVVQGDTESKTGRRRTSVLICLHSGDTAPLTLPHGHFCLEPVLFKLLFGVEAALSKSPVILCGLPDGRLCFLPLRLPGARLRVLHSLEQPVVFVGASVVMETGPGHAQCLVAMGEQGRVVLIKTEKGGSEDGSSLAGFTEGLVAGPVQCGCLDRNCLYYSTGSDLLLLDLSEGSSGKEGKERDEETSRKTLQSPASLNVCSVVALAEPTSNTSVQLLGLSVRGQLQRISLPARRKDAGLSKLPSTQVGRSIRDLLSAIGDVCERASVLKTAIKSKNQILRHLNQVVNISFLLTATSNTEDDPAIKEKPIRCHAMTSWSRLLQTDSLNLTCVLDNSSPYVLERGWTLSITVFPLCCSSAAREEISSTNFSFPFQNLHSGETLEVSLPIAAAGDSSFPMTVNCSLIFSLSSLLGEQEAANCPGLQSSNISLPLNTLTVDWLNALQLNSATARHKMVTFQSGSITTDAIQAFISSQQMRCSGRADRGGESGSTPEKYSASVRVSSELLKDSLVLKNSNLDPKVPKMAPESLSQLSTLVVQMEPHCTVELFLQINVEEENTEKEERLTAVEVQVESSSIAAVCGLHHAVLSRIQVQTHTLNLIPCFQKFTISLQSGIQQSQISEALGVGMTAGQMNPALLSVYQELRQNPLLII